MNKTRIISLLLMAAIFCAIFTGCMGGKTVMTIGGNAISEDIYTAGVAFIDAMNFQQQFGLSMKDVLDQELGDGVTGAELLKETTDSFFKQNEAAMLYAKEKGVDLTAEEKKAIEDNKNAQIEAAEGGRKAFLDSLEEIGMNEAFYDYYMEGQYTMDKIYAELFQGEGEFAPSVEEVVASVEGKYARVKHVLIQTTEGAEDYEAKKAEAEKIAARAKAGEDFDALIAEIAEAGDGDPGMQTNTEGYVIDEGGYSFDGSGQMITEFTTASHALEVNGVSDVVPSPYGFHIIKRYTFDAAYITENYETYSAVAASNALQEKIMEFVDTLTVEHTEEYDKIDLHALFGVEKTNGAGAGEHSADDGHDHGAEAETEGDASAETGAEAGTEAGTEATAE